MAQSDCSKSKTARKLSKSTPSSSNLRKRGKVKLTSTLEKRERYWRVSHAQLTTWAALLRTGNAEANEEAARMEGRAESLAQPSPRSTAEYRLTHPDGTVQLVDRVHAAELLGIKENSLSVFLSRGNGTYAKRHGNGEFTTVSRQKS